jgi:hypothetical protein
MHWNLLSVHFTNFYVQLESQGEVPIVNYPWISVSPLHLTGCCNECYIIDLISIRNLA